MEMIQVKDFKVPQILRNKTIRHIQRKIKESKDILQKYKQSLNYKETIFSSLEQKLFESISKNTIDNLVSNYLLFFENYKSQIVVGTQFLQKYIQNGKKGIVFEGSQGALLDRQYGFYPHITKTSCTFQNADLLLTSFFSGKNNNFSVNKLGVLRCYGHRHGAGPFITEITETNEKNFLEFLLLGELNGTNVWQGKFRVGWLDLVAIRYGISIYEHLDGLSVTHLDKFEKWIGEGKTWKVCCSYEFIPKDKTSIPEDLLNRFFTWDYYVSPHPSEQNQSSKKIRILEIKPPALQQKNLYNDLTILTNLLFQCTPLEWKEFKILKHENRNEFSNNVASLQTEDFLKFLHKLLQIPIQVASFGPKKSDKKFYF